MPARDYYHNTVKSAIQKDGWRITEDSYLLKLTRRKNLFVDLGAERLIAAEKGLEKIAIEVKSFGSASEMKDLEQAIGQFVLYEHILNRYEPERKLYLAVSEEIRQSVFEEEAGIILIEDRILRLVSFNPTQEEIVKWIF
ncbi:MULTISPECIES: element excision factor XisH family protein [Okeania]|uniref:Fatty-acid oxidation protein subunit alpha n=1 Tax=Okeania hirsuta TaxID=1458930 RepID=A0A3N6N563_9CYAN|nr:MULTISPECIES: element excision factor XisH family protein [Okeania]NET12624.1 fatty-acid oxidation protein subunit alpha [Okeania sp. SIO1H6]NES75325.1 fatty-acid oxidation protein subunit alpha [Okeania sp. SIO1H4]NES90224.1 fatty-acid oxidation protein subunit alpha [Okeania sp. SIO2B9]NET19136.1 fatty-acid oxidation protein subunit alpha [Okeania sp. SIO1H5]NET75004.1 fatty-acid oxidation protein subunit alpha [Okeania sp. SIO1F9]